MRSSGKTAFLILFALTLAGGAILLVLRQNTLAALRAENRTLSTESDEAGRLARENGLIPRLREDDAEARKLRAENAEVLKLRNEAGQLRQQLAELSKPPAYIPSAAVEPVNRGGAGNLARLAGQNFFGREDLLDQGLFIPRATIRTYYWAMREGNVNKAIECLTPAAQAAWQAQSEDALRKQMQETMRGFTGYSITSRTVPSQDEIILGVQLNGAGESHDVHFKLINNQWKIDQ